MKNDKLMVVLLKDKDIGKDEIVNIAFNSKDFYSCEALAKFVSFLYDNAPVLIKDLEADVRALPILETVPLHKLANCQEEIINGRFALKYSKKDLPKTLDRKIMRQFIELIEKMEGYSDFASFIVNNYLIS